MVLPATGISEAIDIVEDVVFQNLSVDTYTKRQICNSRISHIIYVTSCICSSNVCFRQLGQVRTFRNWL